MSAASLAPAAAPSPATEATPAICAQGLSKAYTLQQPPLRRLRHLLLRGSAPDAHTFWALRDVSFSLPRGSVLGVVGRNGAGKSTLLQLLCGTLRPSAGTLAVHGRIAALLELGAGFNPDFSGRENVFMNAAILGVPEAQVRERFDAIVAFAGLADFIEQPVRTYSSGMYVRLAFSVATAFEPDILIIDEALSVGDGAFARKSFDRIMTLKERGATILFCSHSLYQIEAICNQALWLEAGRVQMLDEPHRVTRAYAAALDEGVGVAVGAGDGSDAAQAAWANTIAAVRAANEAVPASVAAAPSQTADAEPTAATARPAPLAAGQARLLGVQVAGARTGEPLLLRSGMDALECTVQYQIAPELPPPALGVVLETEPSKPVFSTSSALDGVVLQRDTSGCGEVHLRLPALPLMTGSYLLSIFLLCERNLHIYDHATHCFRFEVRHHGPHQGLVFLPRTWNGQAVPLVPAAVTHATSCATSKAA